MANMRTVGQRVAGRPVSARLVVVLFVVAALMVSLGVPMASAQAPVTGYGSWGVSGSGASWTGTFTPPSVAGFPSATLVTNSLTPATPSGATTWLGPTTAFGAVFGTSQNLPYLQLRTTTGTTTSTTTIAFASPTPVQSGGSGWGFSLGDIDADKVTVSATDISGNPVTAAQLGWQGAFNYCAVSPKPSGCPSGDSTDVPTWDPSTATLTGNVLDTGGASGWFRPTVPLATLTLVFTPLSGLPTFQLWVAAAGSLGVSGTVSLEIDGVASGPVAGAIVELLDGAGEPVTVGTVPVSTVTAADGTYAFTGLVPSADYTVRVSTGPEPGEGDVTTVPVDLSSGSVTDADAVISRFTPDPSTTTTSTTVAPTTSVSTPTTTPPTTPATTPATLRHPTSSGGLPVTGADAAGLLALAGPMVVSGTALMLASRRRRSSQR